MKVVFPVPPSPTAHDHRNRAQVSPEDECGHKTRDGACMGGIDGEKEGVQMSGQWRATR